VKAAYDKRKKPRERTCRDCGVTMPISEFTPIKACKSGRDVRCRDCRARRARERYRADPVAREKQKARLARNRTRRKIASVRVAEAS